MNKPPARGVKLTTVILAVIVMGVSAALSNTTVASDNSVQVSQSQDNN